MWMLSLGDPVSGALGTNGPREPKRPLVWAVMFIVCVAIALPFVVPSFGPTAGAVVAIVGALTATVADGLPPVVRGTTVDDNLTIPVGALASMAVVAAVF
jgi:dolichol kinase